MSMELISKEAVLKLFATHDGKYLYEAIRDMPKAEQEPCAEGDAISRANLKKRLQEHHDFFVNAYGGFRNLPPNDKSRVDEITHCIAEVVNMPSVYPKTGHWIQTNDYLTCAYKCINYVKCSCCGEDSLEEGNYCPNCGAKMEG